MLNKIIVKLKMIYIHCADVINRMIHYVDTMDTEETLNLILKEKKSISRFGDGEISLIFGDGLKFQDYDKELASRLKSIISLEKRDGAVVALPHTYTTYKGYTKDSVLFWSQYYYKNRTKIYSILNKKYRYADAQITRIYVNRNDKDSSKKYFALWKKIWNNKDVLLVEGEYSRFGVGNDLFDGCKSVERIICPAANAYSVYNKIKDAISERADGKLVLLVLGPTATVLADDLARLGMWVIDTGNLDMEYEWLKMGVDSQTKVTGKYSHEVFGGDNVEELLDQKYESQIVNIIKLAEE